MVFTPQTARIARSKRPATGAKTDTALGFDEPLIEPRAARYVGARLSTMRDWRKKGVGPRYYRAGRLIRYRKVDLDQWIEVRMNAPAVSAA